jgi:hypothetical protein
MMKQTTTALALAVGLMYSGLAFAQSPNEPTEEMAEMEIQPEAIKALDDMATYLRTLTEFRLVAQTTRDDVLDDGQKVQIAGTATYDVKVPDKLKLDLKSDLKWRVYYYDGSTVVQYSPSLALYSVFAAAPTIPETLDLADEKYDVQLPLADLFFWSTSRSRVEALSSAFFIGESRIDGKTCNHYGYRDETVDFQVWIAKHGDPLPCRLVITTTDDPARPEYEATLTWDLEPLLDDTMFSFAPAEGVTRIEQVEVPADN